VSVAGRLDPLLKLALPFQPPRDAAGMATPAAGLAKVDALERPRPGIARLFVAALEAPD
jgi:hypothetical protein